MRVTIEIECDNAAFEDGLDVELTRILLETVRYSSQWTADRYRALLDINGNKVGSVTVSE